MYKVTNKGKDVRRFRDGFLGKDIFVGPGKSVVTKKRPAEHELFKIEMISEKKKSKKEGDKI